MKVVILAGGLGTRISEETHIKPKPMIEIGDRPILWHIMKIYSHFGYNDFMICCGYKGHVIKEYFANYSRNESDLTVDLVQDQVHRHPKTLEPWKVTLVNTGERTMTGGRIKRIQPYIEDEPFLLTYGDGVANVNIRELVNFHASHGKIATLTAVQPQGRFGALTLKNDTHVEKFEEKPKGDGVWANGGFFVFNPEVFNYIDGDDTVLEQEPLKNLAKEGQLQAFKHSGFWHPMDTLRDKHHLVRLWDSGQAPWKIW